MARIEADFRAVERYDESSWPIREDLERILQTLRLAEHPTGAIQIKLRLSLWLFQLIFAAGGKTDRIRPLGPPEAP